MRRAVTYREVLLASARADDSLTPLLAALPAREWDPLVAHATALGMAGHLHRAIDGSPGSPVPDAARRQLSGAYYASAARNAALLAMLREVIEAFRAKGIPCLVLKGAAIIESVYRDLGRRAMYYVDLMVPKSDLSRASDVLGALGFSVDERYRDQAWYLERMHHLAPFRRAGLTLEIHHRLAAPDRPGSRDPAELWERARAATIAGTDASVLSPTDLLLHLIEHLAGPHQLLGGLPRIRDIVEVTRAYAGTIDWDLIPRLVGGRERLIATGVLASVAIGAAGIPVATTDALTRAAGITRSEARALTAIARRHALITSDDGAVPSWLTSLWLEQLLQRRGWLARSGGVLRGMADRFAAVGEDQGFRALALPYGLFVHPWKRVGRLLRRGTDP